MFQLGEKTVGDLMSSPVISIDDREKLSNAIRLMDAQSLSAAPVVDNQGNVVGILSSSDLLNMFGEIQTDLNALHAVNEGTREFLIQLLVTSGENVVVQDVMRSPAVTTTTETNIVVAAQLLHNNGFHHLPVVDDESKPVGMLSTFDLVGAIAKHGATMAG